MANTGLDLSLDDLIKQRKQASRGGRGGGGRGRGDAGGRGGSGPVRRNNRGAFRPTPYSFKPSAMDIDGPWNHDLFAGDAGIGSIETGTKLYISNLDFGVSNEDIRTLFSEIGELKRSSVNYDRSGRSKGTAEVVYVRKADALAAMQKYSNVQLDGKLMKIELIGTNLPITPVGIPFNPIATLQYPRRGGFGVPFRGRGGRGGFFGGRGAARGRGGRGRGRGRTKETPKTQEELDAELDAYQSQKEKASSDMQV